MARTPTDVLWKEAKRRAKLRNRENNIKFVMEIYKKLGGEFKSFPIDRIK